MKRLLAAVLACLTLWSVLLSAPFSLMAEGDAEALAELPASYSLIGSFSLPPIDNQGSIGSCVSQTATYTQFTNAVARYLREQGNTEWNPSSGDDKYIFSPKWTYNYSGSGTVWVYDILLTMGCVTQDVSKFHKSGSASIYKSGSTLLTNTTSWDVGSGVMEDALSFRLNSYEQIWTREVAGETVSGGFTGTAAGQALLNRIKAAVLDGNVVLSGGISGAWTYGKITGDGEIGKAGDHCIYAAVNNGGGGHQVSIVGYDDEITYTTASGNTLKGAFQVANSWGTSWGNQGYTWVMYDAINGVSQFSSDPALSGEHRTWAMDQFGFTNWRTDIAIGHPDLMLSVDVTTTDRDAVSLTLTRTDADGKMETYQPKMFYYGDLGYHDNYEVTAPSYLNYAGVKNGAEATAYFTFSYEDLADLPDGSDFDDYIWGFQLEADAGATAKIGTVTLKDKDLEVLFTRAFNTSVGGTDATKVLFSCSDKCYIQKEEDSRYTIQPQNGLENTVTPGDSYSFTVQMASGYTDDFMTVKANGQVLTPVNGVYTVENVQSSVLISASGIVEDVKDKSINITMYNGNGWEVYEGQNVMVISVANSALDPDIYANAGELGSASYPYYFRLTDKATGISYYMQPASAYYFTSSTLYRLPFQPAGFTAEAGKTYDFTVDVVYSGRTLYTSNMTTKCTFGSTVSASGTPYQIRYTVNGETYATDTFLSGSKTVVREVPLKNGVSGQWKGDTVPATMGTSHLSLTASYGDAKVYTITWVTGAGTFTTTCEEGFVPSFNGSTEKAATESVTYTFDGWDKEIVAATGDVTYTAQYTQSARTYKITWVVNGQSTEETYAYGETPSFKGSTAKPSDDSYSYTFKGWDKAVVEVAADATYTAEYTQTALPGDGAEESPKTGDAVVYATVIMAVAVMGMVVITKKARA